MKYKQLGIGLKTAHLQLLVAESAIESSRAPRKNLAYIRKQRGKGR